MAPTTPAGEQWESIPQAAKRTGFSQWMIREHIAEGRLLAYRVSNKPKSHIRLKVADVDAMFTALIPAESYGSQSAGA
ncbi:DNA-binding protein [Gordonia sp. NPDC003425]